MMVYMCDPGTPKTELGGLILTPALDTISRCIFFKSMWSADKNIETLMHYKNVC